MSRHIPSVHGTYVVLLDIVGFGVKRLKFTVTLNSLFLLCSFSLVGAAALPLWFVQMCGHAQICIKKKKA